MGGRRAYEKKGDPRFLFSPILPLLPDLALPRYIILSSENAIKQVSYNNQNGNIVLIEIRVSYSGSKGILKFWKSLVYV
jgi:hypothetical protein